MSTHERSGTAQGKQQKSTWVVPKKFLPAGFMALTLFTFSTPAEAGPAHARMGTYFASEQVQALAAAYDEPMVSVNPYGFTSATLAQDCASTCHPSQLLEWEEGAGSDMVAAPIWDSQDAAGNLDPYNTLETGSMHNLSWKDYEFQLIYHEQTDANAKTCIRCHVPDTALAPKDLAGVYAPFSRGLNVPNASEGITCVSCHLTPEGEIAGDMEITASTKSHAVVVEPSFVDGVSICASCHDDPLFGALSATVTEHLSQRPDANTTCVSCHMTDWSTGEIRHSFPGGHSPTKLKAALSLTVPATITTRDSFSATLKNVGAMHNVPTGEQFRAFVVSVKVFDSKNKQVLVKEVWLTPAVITPTEVEVVGYDRIDPLAYQQSKVLRLGTLSRGTYSVKTSVTYYQVKPATMKSTTTGATSTVTAFGKSQVSESTSTLTVKL
ncbi:MAG: hypothetical protein ACKO6N_23130 [Myxococcota bacterium]